MKFRLNHVAAAIAFSLLVMAVARPSANGSPAPGAPDLPALVGQVRSMIAAGQPRGQIAGWLCTQVDQRLIALNLDTPDERQSLSQRQYNLKKSVFDAWSNQGSTYQTDEPYAAAHWVWANGFGHCQEHAHTVFHVLLMALEDGESLGDYMWGDHAFVVWGVPANAPDSFTLDVVRSWKDAYLIDPWLGTCFATSDARSFEWYRNRGGSALIYRVGAQPFRVYQRRYGTWLAGCSNLAGNYGLLSDELMVTQIKGRSNIDLGQVQKIRPAGDLHLTQNQCELSVKFKSSVLRGRVTGSVARLTDAVSGTLSEIVVCSIKIGGRDKLLVTLVGKEPRADVLVVREGLLSRT
jgi:hypothetical protein